MLARMNRRTGGPPVKSNRIAPTALLIAGMISLSGCSVGTGALPVSEPAAVAEAAVGYEGWWNGTPTSGDSSGLPDETVAVNTDTGKIVEASIRDDSGQAEAVNPEDVDYTVTADPNWPSQSVVIIDTGTDEVITSFHVDSAGQPTN